MVPWPIAFLTLFYGVIGVASAVTAWKIISGALDRPLLWPMAWLAGSACVMCGLPLLKPWARLLAIGTSIVLLLVTLAIAGLLAMAGRPLGALLTAISAGVHVMIIRYLQRPVVKAYFREGTA